MNKALKDTAVTDRKYTFWDIAKNRKLRRYTVLFIFVWITLGLGGYGIQFGVTDLSGNLYINIFVFGLIASPMQFICIYLQNRFGRKKTASILYIICAVTALTVAIAYRFKKSSIRDHLTNVSAITALTVVTSAWSPIQTLTIETYPTVVRNMGFGLQNTMARVGAIIGPQLVFLDTKIAGMMYWICAVAAVVSILLILPIPETFGRDLSDKIIPQQNQTVDKEEQSVQYNDKEDILTEKS